MIRLLKDLRKNTVRLLCGVLRMYRITISKFMPPSCRFYPSCSEYAETSINKYGIVRGTLKTLYRILRCAPWSSGGPDFP